MFGTVASRRHAWTASDPKCSNDTNAHQKQSKASKHAGSQAVSRRRPSNFFCKAAIAMRSSRGVEWYVRPCRPGKRKDGWGNAMVVCVTSDELMCARMHGQIFVGATKWLFGTDAASHTSKKSEVTTLFVFVDVSDDLDLQQAWGAALRPQLPPEESSAPCSTKAGPTAGTPYALSPPFVGPTPPCWRTPPFQLPPPFSSFSCIPSYVRLLCPI